MTKTGSACKRTSLKANEGFTLLELMIAVTFLAVLLAMSAPMVANITTDGQSSERINSMLSSLRLARSEAITSYQNTVVICPSRNGQTCTDVALDWSLGWLVFVDEPGGTNQQVDGTERILRVVRFASENTTDPRFDIYTLDVTSNRLVFDSEGMTENGGSATFMVCDERGVDKAKAVVVNASGQTRLAVDDDGDGGPVDMHDGNDVTCAVQT